jgi:chromosome segregation ATPase
MTRVQLKSVDANPVRSREREALGKAITNRNEALARLSAVRQAIEQAANNARTARHELERAEAAVGEAKTQAAKHAISTALGKEGTPQASIKQARAAVQAAQDDMDSAISAEAELAKELKAAESRLVTARVVFDNAFRAVLAAEPAIDRLLDQRRALNAKLLDVEVALYAAFKAGALPQWPLPVENDEPDAQYFDANTIAEHAPEWAAALQALRKDADTPLPE